MEIFNDGKKWDCLLNLFSTKSNKGEQFEDLVKKILEKMFRSYNLKFTATPKTHDGSKDFWAIDNEHKVWWAECKNYEANVSMKVLAPTLFMAELYDIDFLLFFSYSSLNENLLRKIGLYSNKHNKKVFIYDDISLEYMICKLFPDIVKNFINPLKNINITDHDTFQFNEKNPMFFNAENFDGFYNIDKLISGEIYNLNTLIINRTDKIADVLIKVEQTSDLKYFRLIGEKEAAFSLNPCELLLFSHKVQIVKNKNRLSFPQISVIFNKRKIVPKEQNNSYKCDNGHNSLTVGANYEYIVQRASKICCKSGISGFLVYGNSGSGKTHILYECYLNLLLNDYKILNFTNFDNGNNWKDVLREIVYNIFAIDENMVLDILCTIQNENPFSNNIGLSEENKSVYEFLSILKNCDNDTELIDFYKMIFEKMRNNKYALIIDNLQSYSPQLVVFFEQMIDYYLICNRSVNVSILFSLNIELIFDNCFSAFLSKFIKLQDDCFNSSFYCEEITGFLYSEQAVVFLNSKLRLSDFPLYSNIKLIIKKQGILKPKYLEQIAEYLINRGCITIVDNQGYIDDYAKLEKCLSEIPTSYRTLFIYNYQKIIDNYKNEKEQFKLIFSVIYLFEKIENIHIDSFKLSRTSLKILQNHGILKNNGSNDFPRYAVEHDLSFECLTTVIYKDLIKIISNEVLKFIGNSNFKLLISNSYILLCKLVCKSITSLDLKKINENTIDNIQNRHKFIFAEHYLNCVKEYLYEEPLLMILKANQICKFVSDHISVQKAELLFENAYGFVKSLPCDEPSILSELFSFYIHMAENKMHMSKHHDVLDLYAEFLRKIDKYTQNNCDFYKEIEYAKAYILNRRFVCGKIEGNVLKHSIDLEDSKKTCMKYGFWDIQFENYFDESNIYKMDSIHRESLLNCLEMGFDAFKKTTLAQKIKFMPNFLSKKLQYSCMKQEFSKALFLAEQALKLIDKNRNINYHLFFKKRYLKYKFICLVALDKNDSLSDLLQELSVINDLSGNIDKFEMLCYNAIYFFILKKTSKFQHCYEKMYSFVASGEHTDHKNIEILMDFGIKLRILMRSKFEILFDLDWQSEKLYLINKMLTANAENFEKIKNEFQINAPIIDEKKSIGFYY
ncbi:MAG: restriction endonuclease [Prevotella sp.]|nr:restriction endonuclease [Prevotella sp.]